MPTYAYETIPQTPDEKPVRFEVFQKMSAPVLLHHPETGQAVRKVIAGPLAMKRKIVNGGVNISRGSAGAGGCGCATGKTNASGFQHNPLKRGENNGIKAHTHTFGHKHSDHNHEK